jgi:hypothetical protein
MVPTGVVFGGRRYQWVRSFVVFGPTESEKTEEKRREEGREYGDHPRTAAQMLDEFATTSNIGLGIPSGRCFRSVAATFGAARSRTGHHDITPYYRSVTTVETFSQAQ